MDEPDGLEGLDYNEYMTDNDLIGKHKLKSNAKSKTPHYTKILQKGPS